MTVDVRAWDYSEVLAVVDGVRVRVRRSYRSTRWLCQACGTQPKPRCPHTRALAAEPVPGWPIPKRKD